MQSAPLERRGCSRCRRSFGRRGSRMYMRQVLRRSASFSSLCGVSHTVQSMHQSSRKLSARMSTAAATLSDRSRYLKSLFVASLHSVPLDMHLWNRAVRSWLWCQAAVALRMEGGGLTTRSTSPPASSLLHGAIEQESPTMIFAKTPQGERQASREASLLVSLHKPVSRGEMQEKRNSFGPASSRKRWAELRARSRGSRVQQGGMVMLRCNKR